MVRMVQAGDSWVVTRFVNIFEADPMKDEYGRLFNPDLLIIRYGVTSTYADCWDCQVNGDFLGFEVKHKIRSHNRTGIIFRSSEEGLYSKVYRMPPEWIDEAIREYKPRERPMLPRWET